MSVSESRQVTLAAALAAPITVAAPDIVGPLAVFALIAGAAPSCQYVSFAEGCRRGVAIKELQSDAQVNDLVVHNPLDVAVLMYEGEEVLGAQQNRTFDVSVLVSAGASLRVPVSCVEAGRWDGARHADSFAPAPQAAYPQLRRLKNERVRQSQREDRAPRAAQGEVWDEIAAKSARHGVRSNTGAMHDVFERNRALLDAIGRDVSMKCSQVGALAAIAGRFVVLDYVSDVEAFAALQGPLVQGYALDALEAQDAALPAPSIDDAHEFIELLLATSVTRAPAVGIGEGLRFDFSTLAGTGLTLDGELVTLTAFPQTGADGPPAGEGSVRARRVRRPSRRAPR
jgi:hypothetical protein